MVSFIRRKRNRNNVKRAESVYIWNHTNHTKIFAKTVSFILGSDSRLSKQSKKNKVIGGGHLVKNKTKQSKNKWQINRRSKGRLKEAKVGSSWHAWRGTEKFAGEKGDIFVFSVNHGFDQWWFIRINEEALLSKSCLNVSLHLTTILSRYLQCSVKSCNFKEKKMFIYFEREARHEQWRSREREGERENPRQAPCCQLRAWLGAWWHEPWDHDLSWNRVRCSTNWVTQAPWKAATLGK